MMVIAKKKAENKTTRNVSGASDFHSSSSSSATATIESRNVINCLFITSQEILLCFFFGMLSKKTTSKARAIGIHTHHKKARNVTAERVKAKKKANMYVLPSTQSVCRWSQQQLNFFSSPALLEFEKSSISRKLSLRWGACCVCLLLLDEIYTQNDAKLLNRVNHRVRLFHTFFVCWSPSSSSSTRSNDRVNDECV